jgi:hypothetical protein
VNLLIFSQEEIREKETDKEHKQERIRKRETRRALVPLKEKRGLNSFLGLFQNLFSSQRREDYARETRSRIEKTTRKEMIPVC